MIANFNSLYSHMQTMHVPQDSQEQEPGFVLPSLVASALECVSPGRLWDDSTESSHAVSPKLQRLLDESHAGEVFAAVKQWLLQSVHELDSAPSGSTRGSAFDPVQPLQHSAPGTAGSASSQPDLAGVAGSTADGGSGTDEPKMKAKGGAVEPKESNGGSIVSWNEMKRQASAADPGGKSSSEPPATRPDPASIAPAAMESPRIAKTPR